MSLGEGNTPLLHAPALGLGDVWIKDESRNPTWSFKDRLGSGALTMARKFGAKVIAGIANRAFMNPPRVGVAVVAAARSCNAGGDCVTVRHSTQNF